MNKHTYWKIFISLLLPTSFCALFGMTFKNSLDFSNETFTSYRLEQNNNAQNQPQTWSTWKWDSSLYISKEKLHDFSSKEWIDSLELVPLSDKFYQLRDLRIPYDNFNSCFDGANWAPMEDTGNPYLHVSKGSIEHDFDLGLLKIVLRPARYLKSFGAFDERFVYADDKDPTRLFNMSGFMPDSSLSINRNFPKNNSGKTVIEKMGNGNNFNMDILNQFVDFSDMKENRGAKVISVNATANSSYEELTLKIGLENFYEQGVKQPYKNIKFTGLPKVHSYIKPREDEFPIAAQSALESFCNEEGVITNITNFKKYVEYTEFPDDATIQILNKSFSNRDGVLNLSIAVDKYYDTGILYDTAKTYDVIINNFDNDVNSTIEPFLKPHNVTAKTALKSFSADLFAISNRIELEKYVELKNLPIDAKFWLRNIKLNDLSGKLSFQIVTDLFYSHSYLSHTLKVFDVEINSFRPLILWWHYFIIVSASCLLLLAIIQSIRHTIHIHKLKIQRIN